MAGQTPTRIEISTDLSLGRGTVSCDIVVIRRGDKLLYLLATNNPVGLELYHAPEHSFVQVDIPAAEIARVIRWANIEYKNPHMISSCHIPDNTSIISPIDVSTYQRLMRDLVSEKGLHPPGLSKSTPPENVHQADLVELTDLTGRMRDGAEKSGKVLHVVLSGGVTMPIPVLANFSDNGEVSVTHSAVVAFETDYIDMSKVDINGMPVNAYQKYINIPQPVPRFEKDQVNATIMLLGHTFDRCPLSDTHSATLTEDEFAEDQTRSAPKLLTDTDDFYTCKIMYIVPTFVRLSLGLNTALFNESSRNGMGLNGVVVKDMTEKRLLMVTEVKMFSVPTICGCAIRDLVHFERPHIPLLLAPRFGREFVFKDHPDGVRLTIDGIPSGIIRTEKRHNHDSMPWVDWTMY